MKRLDTIDERFLTFQSKLLSMVTNIDELLEDQVFQDCIGGSDEINFDQTKEFFLGILKTLEDIGSNNNMTEAEIIANRLPDET